MRGGMKGEREKGRGIGPYRSFPTLSPAEVMVWWWLFQGVCPREEGCADSHRQLSVVLVVHPHHDLHRQLSVVLVVHPHHDHPITTVLTHSTLL